MKRSTVAAVFFLVESFEEFQHVGNRHGRSCADAADGLRSHRGCQRLVGHVQRHHHNGDAGGKDLGSRLWIDIDVEFGGWGNVAAFKTATAHQHDLSDARRYVGCLVKRHGDVGQRADWRDRHASGFLLSQRLDQKIDCMAVLKRGDGIGKLRPVQTGSAMHMLGRNKISCQRPVGAGEDRHILTACQITDLAGIFLCQGQRNVAGHRCDTEEIEFRTGKR